MLPILLGLSSRLVDADAYAVWRHHAATGWRIEAAAGLSEAYQQAAYAAAPMVTATTVMAVDVENEPVLAANTAGYRAEGIKALLAVPLRIKGSDSGSITFYWRQPRSLTQADVRAASALANLAGAAIGTAELYREQTVIRAAAEAERARVRFLAEASDLMATSLDIDSTLQQVARLSVPWLADLCTLDVFDEEGHLRRAALAFADPEREAALRSMAQAYPTGWEAGHPVGAVIANRRPLFGQRPSEGERREPAAYDTRLGLFRAVAATAYLIVPLVAHGTVLGALGLVSATADRLYTEDDLPLAEEVARRAAVAIEHAQLYRAARRAEEESRKLAARAQTLAAATEAFSVASTDLTGAFETIARTVAELIGDGCVLSRLSDDQRLLEPIALYHADPEAAALARAMLAAAPQRADHGVFEQALRLGEPVLLPVIEEGPLPAEVPASFRSYVERFGAPRALVVPLRTRLHKFGILTVWRSQ